jgi:hypothetical protein
MVKDIIEVVNVRGLALLNDIADDDGPPRPLAVFSRDYINDEDFPAVYVGLMITVLASMRTLKSDAEFYESTLMAAFSLPKEIASTIAKQIETYDVLGGTKAAVSGQSWFVKVRRHIEEGIRRTVNFIPKMLDINWYNDETQNYDIDYLYELKTWESPPIT